MEVWTPNNNLEITGLKRLNEAKELCSGESHPLLAAIFIQDDHQVLEVEKQAPNSKKIKLHAAAAAAASNKVDQRVLDSLEADASIDENLLEVIKSVDLTSLSLHIGLNGLENLVNYNKDLNQEVVEAVLCPAILRLEKYDLGFVLLEKYEESVMSKLIIPMIVDEKNAAIFFRNLKQSSQKSVLEILTSVENPDWTMLQDLDQLDLQDGQVQTFLASVFLKQERHNNKDLKMGKLMLGFLKSIDSFVESQNVDIWSQAISMHESFLKKACELELKKKKRK
jgi:hypothetical protein